MFGAPLIKPLSFSDILDDMVGEDQSEQDGLLRSSGEVRPDMDWFFNLLALAAGPEGSVEEIRGPRANPYGEQEAESQAAAPPAADDEASIAAELALSEIGSLTELKRVRRAFARRNHPDLFQAAVRLRATRRMKIANMLIDRRNRELAAGLADPVA